MLGHLETIKAPSPSQDDPQAGFNFLKRECVRMMGTICYKDKSMQDKVCFSRPFLGTFLSKKKKKKTYIDS